MAQCLQIYMAQALTCKMGFGTCPHDKKKSLSIPVWKQIFDKIVLNLTRLDGATQSWPSISPAPIDGATLVSSPMAQLLFPPLSKHFEKSGITGRAMQWKWLPPTNESRHLPVEDPNFKTPVWSTQKHSASFTPRSCAILRPILMHLSLTFKINSEEAKTLKICAKFSPGPDEISCPQKLKSKN